ncbi:Ras GTPase-activating-like protein IQGAP1 [Aphelenchoides besseyi]|nr:Ras GTPase-activating-like protein IQGAP1 [Aphelenchoides besseyi]
MEVETMVDGYGPNDMHVDGLDDTTETAIGGSFNDELLISESPIEQEHTDEEDQALSMDELRQRRNVNLYVSLLEDVRNWLADCLGDETIPKTAVELEQALCSGVLLAKLAHYFAPELVKSSAIFDADETRFAESGLQYRHTDNINYWRKACIQKAGLREIILPDASDVYSGRNVRTVFALISLAKKLSSLDKAPPLRAQKAQVVLSEEDYKLIGERIKDEGDVFDEVAQEESEEEEAAVETEKIDPAVLAQELRSTVMEENSARVFEILADPILDLDSIYNPTHEPSYLAFLREYYENENAQLLEGQHLKSFISMVNVRESVNELLHSSTSDSKLSTALKNMRKATAAYDLLTAEQPSFYSLRELLAVVDPVTDIYAKEQELENRKADLNRVLESNAALRHDLHEIETSICMIVANVRCLKEKADVKAEKERKKELENEIKLAASIANDSDNSTIVDQNTVFDDGEPASVMSTSSNLTIERLGNESYSVDHWLAAKISFLSLLKLGVAGNTVKEVVLTKPVNESDAEILQNHLRYELGLLVAQKAISEDGGFFELFDKVIWDIRNEKLRLKKCAEVETEMKSALADATKNANDLLKRIDAYKSYKDRCMKRLQGDIPDITNVADLGKKAGKVINKFLNRKKALTKPVEMNAERLIKKKLLFMDDESTPKEVEKYTVRISPHETEPGTFTVEARIGSEVCKKRQLSFEQLLRHESDGDYRLEFDGPLVFDCVGLRRYLNRKYYVKSFS